MSKILGIIFSLFFSTFVLSQSLGNLAKFPPETKEITVTEVRMSPDLKTAKIFVMPLGGREADDVVAKLKEFSFVIRKVLSKKIVMKFLPKLYFVKDDSFDYAEKIENLIKQTNK